MRTVSEEESYRGTKLTRHTAWLRSCLLRNSTRFRSHVNPARYISCTWCVNELQVFHFQRVPCYPAVSTERLQDRLVSARKAFHGRGQ